MSGGSENGTNNACIQHDVCELKLRCRIITKSIKTDDIITSTCSLDSTRPNVKHPTLLWFDPEHGKRASFILINIVTQQGEDRKESDDDNAVLVGEDEKRNNYQYYRTLLEILDKPAIVVIDCCPYTGSNLSDATETCSFIFGGIDMISNCRTIEIYVIDLQAKETYVTTSRGVKLSSSDQNGNEWFHNIITRPGVPFPNIIFLLNLLVHLQYPVAKVVIVIVPVATKILMKKMTEYHPKVNYKKKEQFH